MVSQDARWATDVVLSVQRAPSLAPHVGLLLGHHFVRIAYEGSLTIRSLDPNVGLPELASLLHDRFGPITTRIRHATKLLDDTKKTFDVVVDEFDGIVLEHRTRFMGNAVRFARWLETDLGLYIAEGHAVGATIPIAYRLGLRMNANGAIASDDLHAFSEEWGGTLAVLNAAAFDATKQLATLDLGKAPSVRGRDVRSSRYLRTRFETEFPLGLKMLLLAIEGDINMLTVIVPYMASGHEESIFRLRIVSLFHALSALRHIQLRYKAHYSSGMRELNQILGNDFERWLLSDAGRAVRNRCMHYSIRDGTIGIDPGRQMFGIVEAVSAGRAMAEIAEGGENSLLRLAELLRNWRAD